MSINALQYIERARAACIPRSFEEFDALREAVYQYHENLREVEDIEEYAKKLKVTEVILGRIDAVVASLAE